MSEDEQLGTGLYERVETQVLGWQEVVLCAGGVQGNEKDRGDGKRET